ncbi:alpha-L-rhamnosidase [Tessaracoccus palaemonis]|uniref:Glycoside hydrolase family 78 protein n=1 Tax=Tessaracoccus palaemonis TaxID=2829499 RepID=A0ABX8SLF6_9ACTN|nr:alpha-L-rhamnosidase [Tessaracoccus palaemonis]QXT63475.1 glycoside hydrolase family 78 protein [Tessaracoccus palaemonis]
MTVTPLWVTDPHPPARKTYRALYLRGTTQIDREVVSARAEVSALGWYRFFINGVDMTGSALVPRWTPFDHYVEYQEYDITEHLIAGLNVLAMAVGDGRFRGRNGALNHQAVYGDRLAGWARVTIRYADGTESVITTDRSWLAGPGRIGATDPKFGEHADLRITDADWLTDDTAPARLAPCAVLDTARTLIPEEVARVQDVARLTPASIVRTPSGKQLVDFGQNAAGVVRIRLRGKAGTVVTLTHSEVVGKDGELDTQYLALLPIGKQWTQTDHVTLDGSETWWQPWFTIHGFRYVEVDGIGHDLSPDDIEYVVLSSAVTETGEFACSDPRLTKLYENVRWSFRSNFTDTPTDCPTRERSGWTGDLQVFTTTAAMYGDVRDYLSRYLRNLAAEQLDDGRIPMFIPAESSAFSGGFPGFFRFLSSSTGWGDASVLVPWDLYRYYGDTDVLARAYPAAERWIGFLLTRADTKPRRQRGRRGTVDPRDERYIVDQGWDFGEWLRPGEDFLGSAMDSLRRSAPVVATAYLEHSARLLSRIAGILDKTDDAARYAMLADNVRRAWRAAFIGSDGTIGLDRQDDYVRAISFGLLDDSEKPAAAARLDRLVRDAGYHLGTGFLSTGALLDVLVDHGYSDTAYRVLRQDSGPSWLQQIDRGATTIWETWEGYTKKGAAKASHNHYSFGVCARFLVERVAGIRPGAAGYRHILLSPGIDSGLDHAKATVGTPHGPATISWVRTGASIEVTTTIPAGSTATLALAGTQYEIAEGNSTTTITVNDDERPRINA